jgi:glycosyltransferase involved in cell wall biosynthesis
MNDDHRSVSVVLPVYLNRPYLPDLYRRLTDTMSSLTDRYELVFVDDAGGDGSLEWLRDRQQQDARVILVELARNIGQHGAVATGLKRSSGDVVVVMDADLQDLPEDIPRLIQSLGTADGVVFARRRARHQSRSRHVTGLLFKRVMRFIAGSRIPIGTGMFFAASRTVVNALPAVPAAPCYVPLLLDQTGATMSAIDVTKETRQDGSSAYTVGRRLRLAWSALRQAIEWRRAKREL